MTPDQFTQANIIMDRMVSQFHAICKDMQDAADRSVEGRARVIAELEKMKEPVR